MYILHDVIIITLFIYNYISARGHLLQNKNYFPALKKSLIGSIEILTSFYLELNGRNGFSFLGMRIKM